MSNHNKLSVFISLILRHKPEVINIKLDEFGYANVDQLINGIFKSGKHIDRNILQEIVEQDKKKRYSFNETKTLIRANQGHSINVNVPLEKKAPPEYLFHGTAEKSINSISQQGINKMNRLYVHLSDNEETAYHVGKRHGKVIILKIATKRMFDEGYEFLLSENGVWLVDVVPTQYIVNLNER
ncbi:RNA 2'-phosphotransferase [Cytobacillus horneckiae]|uniref:RNA 2'-phosphotransferase n=1 Tax=Cytobacillus horneckiae TaxID=549687 RepID=UPI003D9A5F4C